MVQNRVLYTDGRHVTITDTEFQVNNMAYQLRGITKHGLHILKPIRLPGYLLLLAGVFLILGAAMGFLPSNLVSPIEVGNSVFSSNDIIIGIGGFLVLISILVIGLLRERYAVRIATAEGEKDVVVSKQREYITQIIGALNKAFDFVSRKVRQ